MKTPLLQILIPTFNRAPFLDKNLKILDRIITSLQASDKISIIIADNASSDGTEAILQAVPETHPDLSIEVYRHETNIGLEANAVFCLQKAKAPYVMFLGDDDYLDTEYLGEVLRSCESSSNNHDCIIPGYSNLYKDGRVAEGRKREKFDSRTYPPGFFSALRVGTLGHQLSGLTLKREGILEAYLSKPHFRNIYPFVFFVLYNALRASTLYLAKHQVLVSIHNEKDWSYTHAGLIEEFVKNYNAIFGRDTWRGVIAQIACFYQQSWRLFVARPNILKILKGYLQLIRAPSISPVVKVFLPGFYLLLPLRKLKRIFVKKLLKI